MLTALQNRLLTEVEGDAPMGRMMRERYWIPCALTETLIAGGAPKHVKLLGSDYVAFRVKDGRVGFFDEKCPHRKASLVLARNEDCGLRCIFHAWKIDVTGKVVEVPSEGANSEAFASRVKVNHYPTFEGGGLLWVYLGKGEPPPKPPLPFLHLDKKGIWVSRSITPCNWLQGVEGTIDSVHVGTLHQSWIAKHYGSGAGAEQTNIGLSLASHPRYEVEDTAYGLKAAALRTLADGKQYVRVTEYVAPFVSLVPGAKGSREGTLFIATPIDNHSHMLFWGFWNEDGRTVEAEREMTVGFDRDLDNWAHIEEGPDKTFGQNRAGMEHDGHFTGFDQCLLEEDMVVQASMGSIVDRVTEHLCAADVGVARTRRRLLDVLSAFEHGDPTEDWRDTVRPIDAVAEPDASWRELA